MDDLINNPSELKPNELAKAMFRSTLTKDILLNHLSLEVEMVAHLMSVLGKLGAYS